MSLNPLSSHQEYRSLSYESNPLSSHQEHRSLSYEFKPPILSSAA